MRHADGTYQLVSPVTYLVPIRRTPEAPAPISTHRVARTAWLGWKVVRWYYFVSCSHCAHPLPSLAPATAVLVRLEGFQTSCHRPAAQKRTVRALGSRRATGPVGRSSTQRRFRAILGHLGAQGRHLDGGRSRCRGEHPLPAERSRPGSGRACVPASARPSAPLGDICGFRPVI